ncbi:MAG: pentapeptide repeat-containing protein, partial [Verrucomicrobiota bacterium]
MLFNRLFQTVAIFALVPFCLAGASRSLPALLLDSPTLTASEKFVLAQITAGKSADLKSQFPEATNRVLRGAFLEALLTQSGTNVHRNGFSIEHAVFLDAVDLRNAEVHYETGLTQCRFAGEINFSKSIFENGLSLTGSTFEKSANFVSMKIGRLAVFDQTRFAAEMNASQMEITGVFSVREAHFDSPTAPVDFTSLNVGGDTL